MFPFPLSARGPGLAGPALKGGEKANISPTDEMAALAKLIANWRSVVEDNAATQYGTGRPEARPEDVV